ncbi:MAG: hypothetical protein JXL97_16350 [Bacteroidales bacterium]|nr:hypothetical protein [Bacteroidales bacterium]
MKSIFNGLPFHKELSNMWTILRKPNIGATKEIDVITLLIQTLFLNIGFIVVIYFSLKPLFSFNPMDLINPVVFPVMLAINAVIFALVAALLGYLLGCFYQKIDWKDLFIQTVKYFVWMNFVISFCVLIVLLRIFKNGDMAVALNGWDILISIFILLPILVLLLWRLILNPFYKYFRLSFKKWPSIFLVLIFIILETFIPKYVPIPFDQYSLDFEKFLTVYVQSKNG